MNLLFCVKLLVGVFHGGGFPENGGERQAKALSAGKNDWPRRPGRWRDENAMRSGMPPF